MLCRAVPFDRLETRSDEALKEALAGFKKENIVMLFNPKVLKFPERVAMPVPLPKISFIA